MGRLAGLVSRMGKLFFSCSPSFLKIILLKASGARIGNGVKILYGSSIWAKSISIGNNVRIGRYGILEVGELIIEDQVVLGDRFNIVGPKSLKIGEFSEAYEGLEINGSSLTRIGQNCWIGERTFFNAQENIQLGNGVGIGRESQLWTHGYFSEILEGYPSKSGPITIDEDCWLAPRVIVLPGVVIGKTAIISTGSVVTKDIKPNTLNAGVPTREIAKEQEYRSPFGEEKKKEMLKGYLVEKLRDIGYKIIARDEEILCEKADHSFVIKFLTHTDSLQGTMKHQLAEGIFFLFGDIDEKTKSFLISDKMSTYFDVKRKEYLKKSLRSEVLLKKILNEKMVRFNKASIVNSSKDSTKNREHGDK